jgi:hypothetical protein
MCDEFLAGAGFSVDEDSRVGRNHMLHFVENRFEGRTIAYDPRKSVFGLVRSRVRDSFMISHTNSF